MSKKKKRKGERRERVSRADAKANAERSMGGRGSFPLVPPEGVRMWTLDAEGKLRIDVLPYQVSDKAHPDDVKKGVLWWKRIYFIHRDVGPQRKVIICPGSVGQACVICAKRDAIWRKAKTKAQKDDAREAAKAYKTQPWIIMNTDDPEDPEHVALFNVAASKFWDAGDQNGNVGLRKTLRKKDEEYSGFFDVEDGKTLIVEVAEAKFKPEEGGAVVKFFRAESFKFKDREDRDEDATLEKVVDLDALLKAQTPSSADVKAMFEGDDVEEEEESPKKKKGKKPSDDEEDSDEDEEEEEEDEEEEDSDDEEEEEDSDDEDEDDDEDEEEEDEEEEDEEEEDDSEDEDEDD